jgi:hypothetical protein
VSSRTARAIKRNPVSKNKQTNKQTKKGCLTTEKKKKKREGRKEKKRKKCNIIETINYGRKAKYIYLFLTQACFPPSTW